MISPLLDARTKERIIWCDTYTVVNTELGRLFDRQQLPVWLGGACDKTKPVLLTGQTLDEKELVNRYK